jgi:G3E family GTPase
VISVEGAEQRFVYQAVHMIFQGDFTETWEESEPRGCKLTFIGKHLPKVSSIIFQRTFSDEHVY